MLELVLKGGIGMYQVTDRRQSDILCRTEQHVQRLRHLQRLRGMMQHGVFLQRA